jgi:hypothetical protein
MAVQKNFVVRNGLEVNNNLLVADSATDYVGIGTSSPKYTLEVIGGIGVTYANILGISTVGQEFNVGTGGTVITSLDTGLTGFGTATPAYIVDIRSPVSTGQTALYVQGDVRVTGDLYADDIALDQATFNNLEVSGVGTIRTASIDLGYVKTGIVTNLSTSGIGTINTASIDLGYVKTGIVTNLITSGIGSITIAAIRDGYINTGIVTNLVTTGIASIAVGVVTNAYVTTGIVTNLVTSGIGSITTAAINTAYVNAGIVTNLTTTGTASIATGIITTLSGANLTYSGIGSFGSINADTGRINTGIVTNLVTTGIASVNTGVLTSAYVTTGIVTTLTGTTLNYSGIGTIADFHATDVQVSGLTTTGSLAVNSGFDVYAADSTFHGSVTIDGNLSIGGTSAILNAVQVRVEDKDIILGFTTAITPSDDTANHGGVAIASTEGTPLVSLTVAGINTLPDTYKQVMWVKRNTMGAGTTDAFLFNYAVGVGSTQVPNGVRFAVGGIQFTDTTINTTNLNATGVTTSNSYNVGGTQVISSGRQLQNIASLDATTTATIEAAIANAPNTSQDIVVTGIASINTGVFTSFFSPTGIITTLSGANINYSGIGTFGTASVDLGYVKTGIVTNLTTSGIGTITTAVVNTGYITTGVVTTLTGTTLNYSGLSTVGNFRITPVGSGATVGNSGIVTYYGDGSQLSNIISGVGIQSAGTLVGTGFTTLNFIGAGNTFAVNGTRIDISISGGAGAGGTWTTYNAGIATSKSVGVHTSTIDNANLTGVGNSFQGLYVGNGMILVDNQLNGDHYIGTAYNGLMAGPVTINGILTVDGNYVVV